ncbi:hypothetical protein ACFQH6_09055 [Halobacteriaceae archaeon GCM10025711]
MPSSDRFSHPGKVQSGDIFEVFRNQEDSVLSTSDINKEIDWASRSTVRRQLMKMRNQGELHSKKAGEQKNAGEVWYPPNEIKDIPRPTPDIIRVIYRNPWISLMAGGLVFIGFGFVLFLPGFFGEGLYFGLFSRKSIVRLSFLLYSFGIAMSSISGIVFIGETILSAFRNINE